MNDIDILVLNLDDWSGCYMNGELIYEGHSLDFSVIIKNFLINKNIKSFNNIYVPELGELDNYGNRFPKYLSDLKEYK